jgi:hypothetical protein
MVLLTKTAAATVTAKGMNNNELIARFMDMEGSSEFLQRNYDYTKSWDLLMPVVQKVLSMDAGLNTYQLYVSDSLRTANINDVYEAVCDFIKNQPHAG